MKSIMISIKPKWVEKILNGEKTIEIRKTKPKIELPCKVYIYCTKSQELWGDGTGETWYGIDENEDMQLVHELNPTLARLDGKVVAEFTLNKIDFWQPYWIPDVLHICDMSELSCVPVEDIQNYSNGERIYAWHIDDLKIYDNPKELSEFRKDLDCDDYPCNKGGKNSDCKYYYYDNSEGCSACGIDFDGEHCIYKTIKRPPQSWRYVEELENG